MRYMPAKQPRLFTSEQKHVAALGERLRLARLRRKFTAEVVAVRAGISRMTLHRAERGETAVALGTYVRILAVLHLASDLDIVARDDALGRRLQDLELPQRRLANTPGQAVSPVSNEKDDGDEQGS